MQQFSGIDPSGPVGQAVQAESTNKGGETQKGKGAGQCSEKRSGTPGGTTIGKSERCVGKFSCHYCGAPGHLRRNCPKRAKDLKAFEGEMA